MSNSEDFWLISVPGDKTPQESWDKLYRSVQAIATPCKFNIPNLKVSRADFQPKKRQVKLIHLYKGRNFGSAVWLVRRAEQDGLVC